MLILALETTADVCSVAVCDDRGLLVERAFRHRMRLSERLMGDIEEVLRDAHIRLDEVDGMGVGIGPGSFTGVRIGVTVSKTLADVLKKPVCGVSSLEAVAEGAQCEPDRILVPVIRARPGAVYAAFYRAGERLEEIRQPAQCSVEELVAALREPQHYLLCGEGLAAIEEKLGKMVGPNVAVGRAEPPRAEAVIAIARRRLESGSADNALALVPLYIAPPPIDPRAERR